MRARGTLKERFSHSGVQRSHVQLPFQRFLSLILTLTSRSVHLPLQGREYKLRDSLRLLSNLLFPVRLQVRRSDESPLVVFAISIATLMSSIHFCISARELETKTTQLHVNKICLITQPSAVLLEKQGQIVKYSLDPHLVDTEILNCH